MKKLIILIFLLIPVGVSAQKWIRTGVLDPGYYLICVMYGEEPAKCWMTTATGTVIETEEQISILNADPVTPPGIVNYYHWDSGYWIKYKVPWKYIDGDLM